MAIPLRSADPGAAPQPAPVYVLEPPRWIAGAEEPPEVLSALPTASDEGEREQAWARFLEAYGDVLLRSAGTRLGYDGWTATPSFWIGPSRT